MIAGTRKRSAAPVAPSASAANPVLAEYAAFLTVSDGSVDLVLIRVVCVVMSLLLLCRRMATSSPLTLRNPLL